LENVKIFSYYDRPPSVGLACKDPSLTQQHFADDADINNILARFQKTGLLTDPLNPPSNRPQFGDFSHDFNYQEAQNTIAYANQAFMELPSGLRKRFNNDPAELLAFLEQEENRDAAISLGLVNANVDPNALDRANAPGKDDLTNG